MSSEIQKEHPDAILPDLSKHDPLITFTKEDIAFVYGSRGKQRYFKKIVTTTLSYLSNGTLHSRSGVHTS